MKASLNDGQLLAGEFTLPRAFAANPSLGYSTASLGKWHLTLGPTANIANAPANIAGWPHYAGWATLQIDNNATNAEESGGRE